MDLVALFSFFRGAFPYVLAGAFGFSVAWWVQGVSVDHAKNATTKCEQDHKDYVTEQKRLIVEAGERAEKRREETIKDWSKKYADMQKDHDIYHRCVAAGKCGRLSNLPGGSGLKLSTTVGTHAASADAIPAAPGNAEETPQVLRDCAATTLQLNALQDDIERSQVKNTP